MVIVVLFRISNASIKPDKTHPSQESNVMTVVLRPGFLPTHSRCGKECQKRGSSNGLTDTTQKYM